MKWNYTQIYTVLKMHFEGFSSREIQARIGISKTTVNDMIRRWKQAKDPEDWDSYIFLEPQQLISSVYPSSDRRNTSRPLPDFNPIYLELSDRKSRKDLYYFWLIYYEKNPETAYRYTQFREHYHRWLKENHPEKSAKMTVRRNPGEIMYIDWAGDTADLVWNPDGTGLQPAHFFITTLGFSSFFFCKAFPNEKTDSFCRGTADALAFYNALPKILKPDNTKAAVIQNTRDQLVLNSVFADLENFYQVVVVPAPPLKPKGKPSVEETVKWVENKLIERLKDQTFSSFEQLNETILKMAEEMNSRTKAGFRKSRKELFEEVDLPSMRPLPAEQFSRWDYVIRKVPDNYHISYDRHYYSVPFKYLSESVIVKASWSDLVICDQNNQVIARHKRQYEQYELYSTQTDHMPPDHQFYQNVSQRDARYYQEWAAGIGPNMKKVMETILSRGTAPEQNYRTCMGILQLAKSAGRYKAELAAEECIRKNLIGYKYFKNTLKKEKEENQEMPVNTNLRGRNNYR